MLQLKDWIAIKNHPIGVEDLVLGLEECENSHTLTTTITGAKTSQSTIRLTVRINVLCPPKVPSLQAFGLV